MPTDSINNKIVRMEERLNDLKKPLPPSIVAGSRPNRPRAPQSLGGQRTRSLNLPVPVGRRPTEDASLRQISQSSGLRLDGNTYTSIQELEQCGELGNGTCGTVVKMLHKPTNKVIAVKQMRKSGIREENKRIFMDLDIALRCDSTHIVQCLGYFVTEADVWICMELMASCFDKILKRLKGPVPEEILGKITSATVEALSYLKKKHDVIHRDVKPSNILVNVSGDIKLCDFGISGRLVDSKAKTRNAGCAAYMAPERIEPSEPDYDIRADVWSLGITLHELGTGNLPYSNCKNDFEVLTTVLKENPPVLPESGKFSPEFKSFVQQCLTKDYLLRPKYEELLKHPFVQKAKQSTVAVDQWLELVLPQAKDSTPSPAASRPPAPAPPQAVNTPPTTPGTSAAAAGPPATPPTLSPEASKPFLAHKLTLDLKKEPTYPVNGNTNPFLCSPIPGLQQTQEDTSPKDIFKATPFQVIEVKQSPTEEKISQRLGHVSLRERTDGRNIPPVEYVNLPSNHSFVPSNSPKEFYLQQPPLPHRTRSYSNTGRPMQQPKFITGSPVVNYCVDVPRNYGGPSSFGSYTETSYTSGDYNNHPYGSPAVTRRNFSSIRNKGYPSEYVPNNQRIFAAEMDEKRAGNSRVYAQELEERCRMYPGEYAPHQRVAVPEQRVFLTDQNDGVRNKVYPMEYVPNNRVFNEPGDAGTSYFTATVHTTCRYAGPSALPGYHHNPRGSRSQPTSLEAYREQGPYPEYQLPKRGVEKVGPSSLWSPQLSGDRERDRHRQHHPQHNQPPQQVTVKVAGNTSPLVIQRYFHQQSQRHSRRDASPRQHSVSRETSVGRSPEPPRRANREASLHRNTQTNGVVINDGGHPLLRERDREPEDRGRQRERQHHDHDLGNAKERFQLTTQKQKENLQHRKEKDRLEEAGGRSRESCSPMPERKPSKANGHSYSHPHQEGPGAGGRLAGSLAAQAQHTSTELIGEQAKRPLNEDLHQPGYRLCGGAPCPPPRRATESWSLPGSPLPSRPS